MSEQFAYRWREGIRKSEDFWNSCPTCGSLDTHVIRESHPSSGYENTRRCEMCRYEWDTKVYDNDWLDEQCADSDAEEYYVWHNDAYQQSHPEEYPEIFGLDMATGDIETWQNPNPPDDDEDEPLFFVDGDPCPYCQSTNTERIDTINSSDPTIWHCECANCGAGFEVVVP